jgi:hypothetical protein
MCYYCGAAVPSDRQIGFGETCPVCGKDMHVCLACDFYTPGAHWDCKETIDAPVEDKEKRNFCDYFVVAPKFFMQTSGNRAARTKAESARSAFDALFKS